MKIFHSLKQHYRVADASLRLIYINVSIFLIFRIIAIVFALFNIPADFLTEWMSVPASFRLFIPKVWTLITYMFYHEHFFHILFNMITLYWFGKLFLMYFTGKQLTALYLIGGILGALLYAIAFNIFPLFRPLLNHSLLLGASGAILSIVVATAMKMPDAEVTLMFIGRVKLKYIALFFVALSVFGVVSSNGGGQLAHLGGALAGYLFVVSLHKGKDITLPLTKLLDAIFTLISFGKFRAKPKIKKKSSRMNDGDYNAQKAKHMADIDEILDKIKISGYESLSAEEKRKLFDQRK